MATPDIEHLLDEVARLTSGYGRLFRLAEKAVSEWLKTEQVSFETMELLSDEVGRIADGDA